MIDYEIQPPSKPIVKLQQTAQHMANKLKNYTHQKLNMHKLNNPNAEKIAFNRNKYSYMLSIDAKITRYSMSNKA